MALYMWLFKSVVVVARRRSFSLVSILAILALCFASQGSTDDDLVLSMDFIEACTQGNVGLIERELQKHPKWVNGRTPQGETCLHLAAIMGKTDVTRLILNKGGDPNIRTTFDKGQRMHPLSWNVYGGHVETARVLLEHGAHVNLDVDWLHGREFDEATSLDLLLGLLPQEPSDLPELEKYYKMRALLLEYGAMTYSDLQQASEL